MAKSKGARRGLATLDIVIALLGLVLLAAGAWMFRESGLLTWLVISLFNKIEYNSMKMGYTLLAISGGMMGIGVLMLFAALIGLCGSCKMSKACIVIYLTMVIFLVLLQVTLVGLMTSFHSQTDIWLRGKMLVLLKSYDGPTATDDISEGWNSLFRNAKCCGVNDQFSSGSNNSDFTENFVAWNASAGNHSVPATCCQGVDIDSVSYYENNTDQCTGTPINYYDMGCWDRTKQMSLIYLIIISGACVTAIMAEVASIVLGCMVADRAVTRIAPAPPSEPTPETPGPSKPKDIKMDASVKKKK